MSVLQEDPGYSWAAFSAWCDTVGKEPEDLLGAARIRRYSQRGVVPTSVATAWAELLGVELHQIWPEAPEVAAAPSALPGLELVASLPPLPSRAEQCHLELIGAYHVYRADRDAWAEIERLNARADGGIAVQAELQEVNRRLRCELRRIEAWYGSRVFCDVLAALITEAEKKGFIE